MFKILQKFLPEIINLLLTFYLQARKLNCRGFPLIFLKKGNTSVHIYNEEEIDEMIMLIRDSFLPAFTGLEQILKEKLNEAENTWQ